MNTSQHEVIAILKSCQPIYRKIYDTVGYKPTPDDLSCIIKFKELWDTGLMLDDSEILESGFSIEEAGFLIGYIYLPEVSELIMPLISNN